MKLKQIFLNEREILKQAIKTKNIDFLVRYFFDVNLTPIQLSTVRKIVFKEYNKFSISAMTRYGKSFIIAIAMGLYILLNKDQKIRFIAPTSEQSLILRDYLAEMMRTCKQLLEITEFTHAQEEKLTTQSSRAFQTFTNGMSYRVFTAHDEADSLMGHGLGNEGGVLIIDEACQIKKRAAYAKIMRMLGDNPDKTILIELYNPWDRDTVAFEHSIDPKYHRIHIGWSDALKEGRTTKKFIDERKEELTPIEFTVLYESLFPQQAEDAVFNLERIRECIQNYEDFGSDTRIISCDVADKGLDKTVIMVGSYRKTDGKYKIEEIFSENLSESTDVAGRINNLMLRDRPLYPNFIVNIDSIGVGTGVLSMVREFNKENNLSVEVNGCHFGEKPTEEEERFLNKKAQFYFKLKEYTENQMIFLIENKHLIKELTGITWKFNSRNKIQIVDPEEKSPDFADALVYFIWKDKKIGGGYLSI